MDSHSSHSCCATSSTASACHSTDTANLHKDLLLCSLFTAPLLLGMFFHLQFLHAPLMQFALTTPVVLIGFYRFLPAAISSIMASSPAMEVLILIGVAASYGLSIFQWFQNPVHPELYFEGAATIITFVMLGNFLESLTITKTRSALEELTRLQPRQGRKIVVIDGKEEIYTVAAADIEQGDILLVNLGEQIPVDSEVVEGEILVDESIITGESLPRLRKKGDSLIGGSTVVQGSVQIVAKTVGAEATLSRIISLVAKAHDRKPRISRLCDRVSAYFVPAVMAIALGTVIGWWIFADLSFGLAIQRAVAVLVVACPCALGLATPTAVSMGAGLLARLGILVRGGDTIEALAGIKSVVFDKTGTLTTGNFKLSNFQVTEGENPAEVAAIIAALSHHSAHPLLRSLEKQLHGAAPYSLDSITETIGRSISAKGKNSENYTLGAPWLLDVKSNSNLILLKDGNLIASLDLDDELKKEAPAVATILRKLGLHLSILSGDREVRCAQIAKALGITSVYAERRPEEKLAIIEKLESQCPTAYVGDGVNDAPALERARVGIGMGQASASAIAASQVILLEGDLRRLVKAYLVSRVTFRTIQENLFWAFAYNIVAIPIAMMGFLSPMVAALSMAFSDIVIIGNSLRLRSRAQAEIKKFGIV